MLLVAGLCIGCANAWHWVAEQDQAMHDGAMHDEPARKEAEDMKDE
jgi:ATP synthase protein I